MEITKDDRMLLAGVKDKFKQCLNQYRITYTNFLDLHQRSLIEKMCNDLIHDSRDIRCFFWGGYEDAERTMAVFLPDYGDLSNCPLSVIRTATPSAGKKLTHRDYLGSLTGLGIKREMIGDILVSENGADIIVLDDIKDFLLTHYDKVGKTTLSPQAIPISELHIPEVKSVMIKDTVASLRLDNIISSAFRISRGSAATAIRSGLVFVNSIQTEKVDSKVEDGDKLVLRGKGKAYLREVGGQTRKDRTYVLIEKFV